MKKTKVAVSGAFLIGSSQTLAGENMILAKELPEIGFSDLQITEFYKLDNGIELNPNETLRVTRDEEGKNIRFETLDNHVLVVPIEQARGPVNKDVF